MSTPERIVIVGASLAGLRASEALRDRGFAGAITLIGDEPCPPYDRPPLSKQVLIGRVGAGATALPRNLQPDADWRLGVRAAGLDVGAQTVILADGTHEVFDRLLIATGTRARPWHRPTEANLRGVLSLRTREDAAVLRAALEVPPRRVAVIGGGFNGSEIASACCALGVPVTVIEASDTPLAGALGCTIGATAAAIQRDRGVDLRCGHTVDRIEGDADGHVCRVHLNGGLAPIEADVVVVALGSLPNVEWLAGAGLAAGPRGVACDPGCRAYNRFGIATDTVFAAGDVARFPHPLFGFEFVTLEHWSNAVAMGEIAAHNMLVTQGDRRPHVSVPSFWSSQFDISIKSVGVPALADQVAIVQGSAERREFVALYGKKGRVVGAVSFDQGKWLPHYEALIAAGAPFPEGTRMDASADPTPRDVNFPPRHPHGLQTPTTLSGHEPSETPAPAPSTLQHED